MPPQKKRPAEWAERFGKVESTRLGEALLVGCLFEDVVHASDHVFRVFHQVRGYEGVVEGLKRHELSEIRVAFTLAVEVDHQLVIRIDLEVNLDWHRRLIWTHLTHHASHLRGHRIRVERHRWAVDQTGAGFYLLDGFADCILEPSTELFGLLLVESAFDVSLRRIVEFDVPCIGRHELLFVVLSEVAHDVFVDGLVEEEYTSLVIPVWSEIELMVGALLKALMFQVKEAWALLVGDPSSVTVMVML